MDKSIIRTPEYIEYMTKFNNDISRIIGAPGKIAMEEHKGNGSSVLYAFDDMTEERCRQLMAESVKTGVDLLKKELREFEIKYKEGAVY